MALIKSMYKELTFLINENELCLQSAKKIPNGKAKNELQIVKENS